MNFLELPEVSGSFHALAQTSADVVINEVYYRGGSKDEFVELYNSTDSVISLGGWKITDAGGSLDTFPNVDIQPDGFVVVVSGTSSVTLHPNADPETPIINIIGYIGNQLNNDGDKVVILNQDDEEVERLSWGSNPSGSTLLEKGVGSGHSLERVPFGTGDFKDQSQPTPGSGVEGVEETEGTKGPSDQEGSEENGTDEESEEAELTVSFSAPSEVTLGEEFEVEVSLENAVSGRNYLVKFGANDGTLDYGQFSKGYTWSDSLNKFLPFSGGGYSWDDFPLIDSGGGTIKAKVTASALAGDCAVVVRVRDSEEEENYDSEVRMIRAQEAEEEVEEDGDDSGDSESAEGSGEVLGETTTTGTKTSAKKTSSSKSYAFGPFGKDTQQATVSPILSATSSADREATPSTESAFSTPSGEEGSSKFSIISKILLSLGGLVILGVLGFSLAKKRGLV